MGPIYSYLDLLKPEYDPMSTRPVVRRPWGGQDCTQLMLELFPNAFPEGKAMVAIEAGYVGTSIDEDPEEWVKSYCSGLVLDRSFYDEESRMIVFEMHFDEKAVKADSPYKYLVSGPGGGEYTVMVFSTGPTSEVVYEESFCCK